MISTPEKQKGNPSVAELAVEIQGQCSVSSSGASSPRCPLPKQLGHCRAPSTARAESETSTEMYVGSTSTTTTRKLKRPFSSTSRIGWLASLDIEDEPVSLRKTGIICTLGPKTGTVEAIGQLRAAGLNIARLNFSHGTHEYHAGVIANIRKSEEIVAGRPIAIALDTKGPEIRTGDLLVAEGVEIVQGQMLILTTDESKRTCGTAEEIYIDYMQIGESVPIGGFVYVDDGNLQLEVVERVPQGVRVKALNSHHLLSRKGVNLPYAEIALPSVSPKDEDDLRFAVEHGLDIVFASFIRSARDVEAIRQLVGPTIRIISKIENWEGVRAFDSILAVSDGIMVARGDLGIEIPPHKVFVAQKMMIARCNLAGKPVICATQMLESMTGNPRPSRAEATDVANAVLDGADCVMLSAETARGMYPVQAVQIMDKLCQEAESTIAYLPLFEEIRSHCRNAGSVTETVSSSAVNASLEPYVRAIIVLTTTGESAFRVAKFRPQVPIITVTRNAQLSRQLHLFRGCYPLLYPRDPPPSTSGDLAWVEDVEARLAWAMEEGKRIGWLAPGDHVICIQGSRGGIGFTNTLRILPVPQ